MAISKKRKVNIISQLSDIFASKDVVLVVHNNGLNVEKMQQLRREIKRFSGGCLVSKNTLAKIASNGTAYEDLTNLLSGPSMLFYSNDPVSLSKALTQFKESNQELEILGGVASGKVLSNKDVKTLSELPSFEELRAGLVGVLNAPASKLISVLEAPCSQIVRLLSAYAEKQGS